MFLGLVTSSQHFVYLRLCLYLFKSVLGVDESAYKRLLNYIILCIHSIYYPLVNSETCDLKRNQKEKEKSSENKMN